jgi:hypothetical protein
VVFPGFKIETWGTRRVPEWGAGDNGFSGLPPFPQKAREGWGTHFRGGERVGHPPVAYAAKRYGWKLVLIYLSFSILFRILIHFSNVGEKEKISFRWWVWV